MLRRHGANFVGAVSFRDGAMQSGSHTGEEHRIVGVWSPRLGPRPFE